MSSALRRTGSAAATVFWVCVTAIPILGVIASALDPVRFYSSQQEYRAFAARFGAWAPAAFIGLQALQVVITPISHYSTGYMGGFLFGRVWGSLYNYVGRMIGHLSAFFIARRIAPLVRRFVPKASMDRYDRYVASRPDVLFLMYFLPLFPDDEVSYLVGLSSMRFRWFLLANILGQVGGSLSLAYLGAGIDTKDPVFWVLTLSTLAGFPVLWWLTRRTRPPTKAL